ANAFFTGDSGCREKVRQDELKTSEILTSQPALDRSGIIPARCGRYMPADMGEITELLHLWRKGNPEAENLLFERVLPELRRLAHYLMKGERKGHTLQATELVNQIYVRLVAAK